MKIKKVDDKPMVIHIKKKAKIHTHDTKAAKIKGSNGVGDRRCELCLFLEYSSMWSKWCGVCIYLNVVIHKFPRG